MALFVHEVLFCSLLSASSAWMEKVVNLIEIKSQARRGCDEIIQKQKGGQKPGSECLYFRIGSEKYLFQIIAMKDPSNAVGPRICNVPRQGRAVPSVKN